MAATQSQLILTGNVLEGERDCSCFTGVGYGVRHTISGRWYRGRDRYSDDPWPCFDGPDDAIKSARRYLRETEIAFLELVPIRVCQPREGYEAEATRLLAAEPQPLIPDAQS
jgi:hypothetical protein